jgi:hypothetical protein
LRKHPRRASACPDRGHSDRRLEPPAIAVAQDGPATGRCEQRRDQQPLVGLAALEQRPPRRPHRPGVAVEIGDVGVGDLQRCTRHVILREHGPNMPSVRTEPHLRTRWSGQWRRRFDSKPPPEMLRTECRLPEALVGFVTLYLTLSARFKQRLQRPPNWRVNSLAGRSRSQAPQRRGATARLSVTAPNGTQPARPLLAWRAVPDSTGFPALHRERKERDAHDSERRRWRVTGP